MLSVIVRRLLFAIPVLFITSIVTFILQALIPGDAARTIVGTGGTPEAYEHVREQLHLNLPLWQQYAIYIGGVFRGDLGTSLFTGEPVAQTIAQRLPVTLTVVIGATLVAGLIGVLLGAASARFRGPLAKLVDVISLAGSALPNFWLGLVLVSTFSIALPLLPATGFVPFSDSPSGWLASIVLPVVALAVAGIAQIAKTARDGISDALQRDYIRTLRAAKVSEGALLWRHALKNSGVSIVTVVGLGFVGALAGSIFVENVFALPGLGALVDTATNQHDIPVIQGVALAYALIVIAVNLVVDLSYSLLNTKVRVR
ncbi:ABC transporter permease [Leifsonia naganoensis]|uniref:Peptide/nickel transport system permease protein n=1 Tax=Leifsonia naganoensis TaxID=150025 RepID=A0A853DV99_9MICO|nr:ABC transporter permease [Leifsonia naganoensis]NYK10511.1 peptide/nickel transport system permease protein [Leifsonia naganoensis]